MRKILLSILVLFCAILFPACFGKVTGGGSIPSAFNSNKSANFGFNARQCSSSAPIESHFTFHDKFFPGCKKGGGLKIEGTATDWDLCPGDSCEPDCPDGTLMIDIDYISKNPKCPGQGTGIVCLDDNGEPGIDDFYSIDLTDGPYDNYSNSGMPRGNIQRHDCTCTDGIDNDMDGEMDEDDLDCQNSDGSPNDNGDEETPNEYICDDNMDNDMDEDTDCADPDCAEDEICVE